MGRTATYVVLAEDLAGAKFIEGYLEARGVERRAIHRLPLANGRGSGKQRVLQQYPGEVKVYRAKRNHVYKALLTTTDADEKTVAERCASLAEALAAAEMAPRAADEAIVLAVPKWEIETWAIHLNEGERVDEGRKVPEGDKPDGDGCARAGAALRGHRASGPTCCPPSMAASDGEFARLG
jgi:hypothetical protein